MTRISVLLCDISQVFWNNPPLLKKRAKEGGLFQKWPKYPQKKSPTGKKWAKEGAYSRNPTDSRWDAPLPFSTRIHNLPFRYPWGPQIPWRIQLKSATPAWVGADCFEERLCRHRPLEALALNYRRHGKSVCTSISNTTNPRKPWVFVSPIYTPSPRECSKDLFRLRSLGTVTVSSLIELLSFQIYTELREDRPKFSRRYAWQNG